jgi:folate-dependent phosphoribosylglycinamide formyltransferase PurN
MDLEVHKAVLAAGKKESGVTLHFVDETIDGGPIILQKKISVALDETPYSLKEKAQATEQELFVEAIRLFGTGKIRARKQLVEA